MTTADPETGERFDTAEMVDQVAIFFLAGHETSASALAWALYLLATHPRPGPGGGRGGRCHCDDNPDFAMVPG
jgi:hypothetical protein